VFKYEGVHMKQAFQLFLSTDISILVRILLEIVHCFLSFLCQTYMLDVELVILMQILNNSVLSLNSPSCHLQNIKIKFNTC
jgi:hypothetical protein